MHVKGQREIFRSLPEFTLSKHEGVGTRISQSLRSFEMTRVGEMTKKQVFSPPFIKGEGKK
jgi:hypothetical protein